MEWSTKQRRNKIISTKLSRVIYLDQLKTSSNHSTPGKDAMANSSFLTTKMQRLASTVTLSPLLSNSKKKKNTWTLRNTRRELRGHNSQEKMIKDLGIIINPKLKSLRLVKMMKKKMLRMKMMDGLRFKS